MFILKLSRLKWIDQGICILLTGIGIKQQNAILIGYWDNSDYKFTMNYMYQYQYPGPGVSEYGWWFCYGVLGQLNINIIL